MSRLLYLILLAVCAVAALSPSLYAQSARPKIGVVLKGGGALGFAHVGVLKVLERNRVPVDCVAGTSMGAIVGAAYASGATIEQMETTLSGTDWEALFGEKIQRSNLDYRVKSGRAREIYGEGKISFMDGEFIMPQGLVEGQNIRLLFQELFGYPPTPVDFDTLPVPFRAVTADVESGTAYAPKSGDLMQVVRASMSIPGAFSPVEIDGHLLVDGGVVNNLPIDVARDMGCDTLVVVDLRSDLAKRDKLTSPLSLSGQMISLLLMQNSALSLRLVQPQDVVIAPDVNGYAVSDFPKALELMEIGERTAVQAESLIKRLSIPEGEYARYLAERTSRSSLKQPESIGFVRLKNKSHVSDNRIQELISVRPGDSVDYEKIEADVQRIYQSGHFTKVEYAMVKDGGQNGVEIYADGKDWLEQYVRLGFALEDNLEGDSNFRLGANFRTYDIFSRDSYFESDLEIGKSPKVAFELYQPLFEDSPYFVNPQIALGRTDINVSSGGDVVAQYERTEGLASFGIGRRLGTMGEATVAYARGFGELKRDIGDSSLNEFSYDIGDLTTNFDLDTLDKPDFPTSGFRVLGSFIAAMDDLGAPSDFQELGGVVALPMTFGRNTILIRNIYTTTFGDRPIERSYSLGGFLGVSGTLQNSLVASDYNSGAVVFFQRFSEVANPFFDLAFFAGGSVEFTTIHNSDQRFRNYDLINSGSIFLGADTPLLPIYLGFGLSDIDERSIYLSMGRLTQSPR